MDILFLLIPLSVVLAVCIGVFLWRAVDTGQFDDLDTPAVSILADDDGGSGRVDLDQAGTARGARTWGRKPAGKEQP